METSKVLSTASSACKSSPSAVDTNSSVFVGAHSCHLVARAIQCARCACEQIYRSCNLTVTMLPRPAGACAYDAIISTKGVNVFTTYADEKTHCADRQIIFTLTARSMAHSCDYVMMTRCKTIMQVAEFTNRLLRRMNRSLSRGGDHIKV